MADTDTDGQWPSEDEDFDAVADKPSRGSAVSEAKTSKQPAESRSVEVSEPETEEEETPAPADDSFESEAEEPQAEEAPEEAAPESESEAVAEPAVADDDYHEPLPAATKPPKVRKAPMGKLAKRSLFELVLVLALVLLGLWVWSLDSDNSNLKKQVTQLNANPQIAVQKQTQSLINTVGQLIQLPTDETPTIANVSDASQAKQQSAFFANAENGDKVLMYVKAGEAILYRPSTGKIILVAPLTFTNNSTTTTPATTSKTTTTTKK